MGLPITTQQDVYLATDATAFYLAQVPILSAFTGAHPEYHTPHDTIDTVNFELFSLAFLQSSEFLQPVLGSLKWGVSGWHSAVRRFL